MSLDMFGHIDQVFTSAIASRTAKSGGGYVDGIWKEGTTVVTTHNANIQPMSMKQIDSLRIGAERVSDYRNVWINDGTAASIRESDTWTFPGVDGEFKTTMLDNRAPFGRNYCKFVAVRIDT